MMKSKTKKSSRIDFMVGWNDRLKVGGFWKMGLGFLGNSFFGKEESLLSAVSRRRETV